MCGGGSKPAPTPKPAPAPPMVSGLGADQEPEKKLKKKQNTAAGGTKKYRNPVMKNMSINTAGSTSTGGSLNIGG